MLKRNFLATPVVRSFVDWLIPRIGGAAPIGFINPRPNGATCQHLHDALSLYSWPPRHKVFELPNGAAVNLAANASLAANTAVLNQISTGLTATLAPGNNIDFANWAKCLMNWGGVEHGNNKWIDQNTPTICHIVNGVNGAVALGDDSFAPLTPLLRFNSGMTKLYSLLNPNFIIYDSRVAASLAWLVYRWSPVVPHELAFRCMPARKTIQQKIRNPDTNQFCGVNNDPYQHIKWNIRANWILEEAYVRAVAQCPHIRFHGLREVEASLFMLGADLP